jgi:hypothetical protein
MSTVSTREAAPMKPSALTRPAVARWLAPALTIAGVAVLVRLVYNPWYLNYDARYALDWARDLARGVNPDFTAPYASTPHPFSIALSFLGLPFGHGGDQMITWLVLIGFGALVWLAYRLGAVLFNPWVGLVTALVVASRPAILRDTLLGYQDIWFEALVLGAVVLEAERRRRGVPVLGLLALAGLLRPEAWALSGLYLLYLWPRSTPRQRAGYAALVVWAPLSWCLMDLIVTGDLLHSLHGTAALAQENSYRRGILHAPRWTAQYFAFTLREPLAIGIPIGLVFAWRYRCRQVILPLATAAVLTAVFVFGTLFGLPLIGRYVRAPSVLIAVVYGLAVFGWMLIPRERARERRAWLAVGIFTALLSVAFLPSQLSLLRGLHTRSVREGAMYRDLRAAGQATTTRAAFAACAPMSTSDRRPIPYMRWWVDGNAGSVGTIEHHSSPLGKLLLVPRPSFVVRRFYGGNLKAAKLKRPAGWHTVYQNRSWQLYAAPACP